MIILVSYILLGIWLTVLGAFWTWVRIIGPSRFCFLVRFVYGGYTFDGRWLAWGQLAGPGDISRLLIGVKPLFLER